MTCGFVSVSLSQFSLSIKMSTVRLEPLMHLYRREIPSFCLQTSKKIKQDRLNSSKLIFNGGSFCTFKPHRSHAVTASINETVLMDISEASEVSFNEKFPLKRTEIVEGKISVRLDRGKDEENWQLTVGCNLPGKWVLHWGVTYVDSVRSGEWDQPPPEMRPPGSIAIKDYAIESLLKKSSSAIEGRSLHEVQITCNCNSLVAAINFVLKDEETGSWYQHRGRDFKVALMDCVQEEANLVGGKKGLSIWSGAFHQISSIFLKAEGSQTKCLENGGQSKDPKRHRGHLKAFYEEYPILKEILFQHVLSVSVRKLPEKNENLVHLETDLPGEIIVHWGVCRDKSRRWEIPAAPHPPETKIFNKKALRTLLKPRGDGCGSWGLFSLDKEIVGLVFVLNLNDNTWLNCMGSDFYIPLQWKQYASSSPSVEGSESSLADTSGKTVEGNEVVTFTDVVTKFISNLIGGIFSGNSRKTKSKEAHENILQESEKLAEEAYNSFRSSSPALPVEAILDADTFKFPVKIRQGTGSGYEILCQGFNWESHKSRRWYMELNEKTTELSSLGFTMVWLPPPTESVSPEGYMPKDLYNLNSRYGSMEELKILVKRFHEVGIKVLGDVVLNHRCAHYRNQNGVWNIFGGRLNWDDCAVVVDDPHFQGRGNKSSGDHFHAAPNIDHSQDFVRKDLKEWLCWLRKEIGYDGWRLDFVRGFWGGYVKDYLDASEPYFSVGEYWDSLSYTYGEMDPNQDAHRQRIIDWINATNGAAGAFDVTTKGILHAALERCEYWRLSDQKGKPPGVMGWWPSCAVTFIENHDTGSTQGHWRFPGGKEMQGYAYILTHPGTPAVFYDHVFSHYQSEISALISLRHRTKIHCRSTVKIIKAERDVYAAIIDGKVAMKIGPGYYEPPSASHGWVMAVEGRNYKVWEAS